MEVAGGDFDGTIRGAETRRRVERAIRTLPEPGRTLLRLRKQGFSYEDLAVVVGVATEDVSRLLCEARWSLYRRLRGAL